MMTTSYSDFGSGLRQARVQARCPPMAPFAKLKMEYRFMARGAYDPER
jgi:hypothetical protein